MAESQTVATPAAAMAAGLARLWIKFLPEIQERLVVIESAAITLRDGKLSKEQREGAFSAAHKLAGSLGTFGLQRGTELARQAELFFAAGLEDEVAMEKAQMLSEWVDEIRELISERAQV